MGSELTRNEQRTVEKSASRMEMRSSPSSKNWIEQYREQGFAIFEKLISSDLIESHLRSYEQLLHQYGAHERGSLDRLPPEERAALDRDIENIYSRPELSLPLCRDQGIHTLASELFGSESVSWTPLTLIWGGGAIPHRDLLGYRDPACEAVRLWIALEDLHDESGLLYVVPGSHESGYRYDELLDERPEFLEILRKLARGGTDASSWHVLMKPILDHHHEESACIEASRPKRILRFKKGDALLFDPALVHGSLVAGDPALTRRSFILECRSRRCRVFSMRAYFGSKHDFRLPENALPEAIVESPLGPYGKPGLRKIDKAAPVVGFK